MRQQNTTNSLLVYNNLVTKLFKLMRVEQLSLNDVKLTIWILRRVFSARFSKYKQIVNLEKKYIREIKWEIPKFQREARASLKF